MSVYPFFDCGDLNLITPLTDALIVCQLADGSRLCDNPPKVLYSVAFPNEQLDFKFEQVRFSLCANIRP